MTERRPVGITIFSWAIILGSVANILSLNDAMRINPGIWSFMYLIISPVSIVGAIYLLRQKDWARRAIVIISLIVAAETLVTAPQAVNDVKEYDEVFLEENFETKIRQEMEIRGVPKEQITEEQIEKAKGLAVESAKNVMVAVVIIMLLVSVGFNAGAIYYFTRPRVKERFT